MMRLCLPASLLIALCSLTLGCKSSDSHATTPACVTRSTAHDPHEAVPSAAGHDSEVLPDCAPTCGREDPNADGFASVAALPAGKCSSGDAACDMGAYTPCACSSGAQPVSVYRCACSAGEWRCEIISAGAGVCPRCDAGAP